MAVPPNSPWNPGPTRRLNPRPIQRMRGRLPDRPHSRRRGCGTALFAAALAVVVLIGGAALYAWSRYQTVADSVIIVVPTEQPGPGQEGGGNQPLPTPNIVKEPFNILLVGVDTRDASPEEGARSDTLILAHVDPQNKWATMLSIPRDSCAEIPGYTDPGECDKINKAYFYGYRDAEGTRVEPEIGGIKLARDTVSRYLDLPSHNQRIDFVAQVDFKGFQRIIDAIGGINIDVPKPLLDPSYPSDDGDNGYIRLYIPSGLQHMDGVTALRYARSRHADDDYQRSERQKQVIQAIMSTMKEKGLLDQIDSLNDLMDQLANTFSTDLPIKDLGNLRALAGLGAELAGGGRIQSLAIGGSGFEDLGGLNIYTPRWNPDDISVRVDEWLTGPLGAGSASAPQKPTRTQLESVSIEVMNGTEVKGLAGEVRAHLESRGYVLNAASSASAETAYPKTLIIDYGNHKAVREYLAHQLGIKPANILASDAAPEGPSDGSTGIMVLLGLDYKAEWRR